MSESMQFVLDNWESLDSYMHTSMSDDEIRSTLSSLLSQNNFSAEEIMLTIEDSRVIMLFKTHGRH